MKVFLLVLTTLLSAPTAFASAKGVRVYEILKAAGVPESVHGDYTHQEKVMGIMCERTVGTGIDTYRCTIDRDDENGLPTAINPADSKELWAILAYNGASCAGRTCSIFIDVVSCLFKNVGDSPLRERLSCDVTHTHEI